jgi:hypothetical protein
LVDQRLGGFRARSEILYVWSGEHLRRALPGFEAILADIYWLRTVQYYGHQRVFEEQPRFELLEPLVRITIELDPHFEMPYRYGATFLAEHYPRGADNAEAAVDILRRGTESNPNAWLIWQYRGLFQAFFLGDGKGAARVLRGAARRPGAPPWLEHLAALALRRAGDRAGARAIWQSIYDHAEEEEIRDNAATHLARYDTLDVVDALNDIVERFRETAGRNPGGWEELRTAGLLRQPPIDASGMPFIYDPETGLFSVDERSLLYIVPMERAFGE